MRPTESRRSPSPALLARQMIPCIDVREGAATSPSGAGGLSDPCDVVGIAAGYARDGAEQVFLDIVDAWPDSGYLPGLLGELKATGLDLLVSVQHGTLPSPRTCAEILTAGATAVSVSTSMVAEPDRVAQTAQLIGPRRLMGVVNCSGDRRHGWHTLVDGGATPTTVDALHVARRFGDLKVRALLANSVDREGTGSGYDLDLTRAMARASGLPAIASGGAGSAEQLADALRDGDAAHVLVNDVVHSGRETIGSLSEALCRCLADEAD
ncbi:HisA/HisF-related TIM barrel protein [Streptomyces sp. Tu 6176]|uniref:HisA/HisF-related TIM barrel protein n=1 Tax=Streptomyces sp. Tu 6176 TaxID=1470557 RepID=UPI000B0B1DCE|nr:HisA/HisF-related TIM barrel protein [Streptomyces sp. Tu 6176]